PSVWPALSRAEVAAGAIARIDDPNRIHQRETNLCGLACLVRSLVTDAPTQYALTIVDLFEKGSTVILGHHARFKIRPRNALKQYALPATAGINQADWIIMASIRDSENWFIGYTSIGGDVSALTTPKELTEMFEKAGYMEIDASANPLRTKDIDHALQAG